MNDDLMEWDDRVGFTVYCLISNIKLLCNEKWHF